jgi:phage gpG-like protein
MADILIEIHGEKLEKFLADLTVALVNPEVMAEWASVVESSILRNFMVGGRASTAGAFYGIASLMGGNSKWKPLAPSTIELRKKLGYYPITILVQTARMRNSIAVYPAPNGILMTVGAEYAEKNNLERPFMVIQQEDIDELADIIARHPPKT